MSYYRLDLLRYAWRRGFAAFLRQAALIARRAFGYRRTLVFMRDLWEPDNVIMPSPVPGLVLTSYRDALEIPEALRDAIGRSRRWLWRDTEQLMKQGWRLWIGTVTADLASVLWSWEGIRGGEWVWPVEPGDVVLWYTATLPAFRGRGIQKVMHYQVIETLRSEGCRRVFGWCDDFNLLSRRNIERAGFRLVGVVRQRRGSVVDVMRAGAAR